MKRQATQRNALRRTPLALLLALVPSCGSSTEPGSQHATASTPEGPRLVLLVATCTLNKSYLGPYNPEIGYTPNFDRFAEQSTVFTAHQTESGLSGTSFASIFSGVQADRHGVFKHPRKLDDELYLVFEAFADAGYDTYYWNHQKMAAPELNYSQGVDEAHVTLDVLRADDRFGAVLDRLDREPDYRALVVAAYTVTHGPYSRDLVPAFIEEYPDELGDLTLSEIVKYHELYLKNCLPLQTSFDATVRRLKLSRRGVTRLARSIDIVYRSRVNYLDSIFGEVVDAIDAAGLRDDSLVAFTSDHGETLYRRDRQFKWTHAPNLAPEVLDVAFMIRSPNGNESPRVVNDVTRSIDVYPTLAGLAGFDVPTEHRLEGVDLSSALRGDESFPMLDALSHGTLRQWSFFVPDLIENIWAQRRTGDTVYMWRRPASKWEFVVSDARTGEALDSESEAARSAARELWSYREHLIEAFRAGNTDEAQSKEEELERLEDAELETLRSLGYVE